MSQAQNMEQGSKDLEKYCKTFHLNVVDIQVSSKHLKKLHLQNK